MTSNICESLVETSKWEKWLKHVT